MTTATPDRRAIITDALRKIDDLSARLADRREGRAPNRSPSSASACRFPAGWTTPTSTGSCCKDGRSGIVRVPPERWDADAYYTADHTVPGTICNREGGFLTPGNPTSSTRSSSASRPREALAMDPQQRLLLEVAWEALEDAGHRPRRRCAAARPACSSALTTYDYMLPASASCVRQDLEAYMPPATRPSVASGRLSYILGLEGPAVTVDTACSSSLVALHLACQACAAASATLALAGGVNRDPAARRSASRSRGSGCSSPDGRCKAFAAAADGTGCGEGGGVRGAGAAVRRAARRRPGAGGASAARRSTRTAPATA